MFDPYLNSKPVRMAELLDDFDARLPGLLQNPLYAEWWHTYEVAGAPYGRCHEGMMAWLCERDGIDNRAWYHLV